MKHFKRSLLILTICIFAFSSCKKDSSKPNSSSSAALSMQFNGSSLSTSTITATYSKSENVLQIAGTFSNKSALSIDIPYNVQVGSFDIASEQAIGAFINGTTSADTYLAVSGTVVITSFTSTAVAGTFNFATLSLSNTAGTITQGKFQATYTTTQ